MKDFRKWAKNVKISYFLPKRPNWAKNGTFWCFWPISVNLWPICYTPLESVKFFWLFKTLKSKIHFFSKKFSKGPPFGFRVFWNLFKTHKIEITNEDKHFGKEFLLQNFIILWVPLKIICLFRVFEFFNFSNRPTVGGYFFLKQPLLVCSTK